MPEQITKPRKDREGNLNFTNADFVMVVRDDGKAKEYDLEDNGINKAISKAREWVSSYRNVKIFFTTKQKPEDVGIRMEKV